MKKVSFKRICALLLTLVMLLGMLPTTVMAAVQQVTINLDGISAGQEVIISVEGQAPVTASVGSGGNIALSIDEPSDKFVKVESADGALVGAALIKNEGWFRDSFVADVTMINAAAGLPINFFIAEPGSQPSATSTYAKYQPFGITQGSGAITAAAFLDPAVHR